MFAFSSHILHVCILSNTLFCAIAYFDSGNKDKPSYQEETICSNENMKLFDNKQKTFFPQFSFVFTCFSFYFSLFKLKFTESIRKSNKYWLKWNNYFCKNKEIAICCRKKVTIYIVNLTFFSWLSTPWCVCMHFRLEKYIVRDKFCILLSTFTGRIHRDSIQQLASYYNLSSTRLCTNTLTQFSMDAFSFSRFNVACFYNMIMELVLFAQKPSINFASSKK